MSMLLCWPGSVHSLLRDSRRSQAAQPSAAGDASGADRPAMPQASANGCYLHPPGTLRRQPVCPGSSSLGAE